MFTGIIQEIGQVRRIDKSGSMYNLDIISEGIYKDIKIGDSVAVNGVCLTVTSKAKGSMTFNVMAETVRKTSLSSLKVNDRVNLEGSLKIGGTLDGHFVLGHVDCVGIIKSVSKAGGEFIISIGYPEEFANLVVDKGSIAIEGVSLTVSRAKDVGMLEVHIIPHTTTHTTLDVKRPGDPINLEFDILGKYIAKQRGSGNQSRLTEGFLRSKGF